MCLGNAQENIWVGHLGIIVNEHKVSAHQNANLRPGATQQRLPLIGVLRIDFLAVLAGSYQLRFISSSFHDLLTQWLSHMLCGARP
jgi:hypothetical protein